MPEGTASRSLTAYHHHPPGGCVFPKCSTSLHLIGTGIFTGCPSHTPPGFCLGPTHPTWTDLPSETLDLRRCRFSLHFATHARILTPHHSTARCPCDFTAVGTLSYHLLTQVPGFGVMLTAPFHFPRSRVRPVSCYALFQGWLLLSQPPGCLNTTTSFPT